MTASSPTVGTWPQSQFVSVLKSDVALLNVHVAAEAEDADKTKAQRVKANAATIRPTGFETTRITGEKVIAVFRDF
jgi:hypothetical protein